MKPARFVSPMLAQSSGGTTSTAHFPPGEWLFEPKMDGLRCLAVRNGAEVSLCSRNNLSFNARFQVIVGEVASLPVTNFVLDGEIVGLAGGRPNFAALQQGNAEAIELWVFDLPWLLGEDTRHLPIEERKDLLVKAVPESAHIKVLKVLKVLKALSEDVAELYERSCQEGWEGLVAKRAGSPYRAGRSADWYKLKCGCRQELLIGGFTAPAGSRTAFGALLLGYWEGGRLMYAGKVGTGFDERTLRSLLAQLLGMERASSPFAAPVAERGARWVEPELVAEIAFTNWTTEGRLRHPSFLGLRPDKASHDVVREPCGDGVGRALDSWRRPRPAAQR
ncbi:MAG TPA: non-homologous end-joining DNA ligase [Acidimicrobiales bacterium]|nr:non-homologous end-joining DNA ligase [Acidimicrobiales bacterium]